MMMLSNIEHELRQIIETLRVGNLESARGRTVELIESVLRMSNPMYREDVKPSESFGESTYKRAPGSLRTLAEELRHVSQKVRRGAPADALVIAEHALAAFLGPEAVAAT
jgi:hypothetical protein